MTQNNLWLTAASTQFKVSLYSVERNLADFEVFRPAGATRCTDGGEIWRKTSKSAILITLLFIDVSASRRKPSSGLTSGAGRQYVKTCPIRGSTGSSPHLDSCCRSLSKLNTGRFALRAMLPVMNDMMRKYRRVQTSEKPEILCWSNTAW